MKKLEVILERSFRILLAGLSMFSAASMFNMLGVPYLIGVAMALAFSVFVLYMFDVNTPHRQVKKHESIPLGLSEIPGGIRDTVAIANLENNVGLIDRTITNIILAAGCNALLFTILLLAAR